MEHFIKQTLMNIHDWKGPDAIKKKNEDFNSLFSSFYRPSEAKINKRTSELNYTPD